MKGTILFNVIVITLCNRLVLQQEQLQTQVERTNELLITYEQSITRKDQIIQTLTKSLQKQVLI